MPEFTSKLYSIQIHNAFNSDNTIFNFSTYGTCIRISSQTYIMLSYLPIVLR